MVETRVKKRNGNILLRIMPVHRFMISLGIAGIVFILMLGTTLDILVKIMIAWSGFALSYIIISWIVFFAQKADQIRELSRQEDGSRLYVFSLIIFTSFASLFTVLLLMLSQNTKETPQIIFIPIAICGMLFSWIMVHTIFAFHYAHMYYGNDISDAGQHAEGLEFPGEKKPDYVDFAYFSFVVGMTFQVSDTAVTARSIRRLVLFHGLISFGLNTFVVALTINLIAGLLK